MNLTTFVPTIVKYPSYIRNYAKRHKLPSKVIQDNSMLNYAAILELSIGEFRSNVTDARRLFVKRYPSTNCIPTSGKLVSAGGFLFRLSVIDLIRPYPRCDFGVPKQIQMIGRGESQ